MPSEQLLCREGKFRTLRQRLILSLASTSNQHFDNLDLWRMRLQQSTKRLRHSPITNDADFQNLTP
jgi:hypothetical protein